MRILFYLGVYPSDAGIPRVTTIMANALQERGYECYIMSHFARESHDNMLNPRISVTILPNSDFRPNKENETAIHSFLDAHTIDAIIFQDSYEPCEGVILREVQEREIPFYVFEHSTPEYILKLWSSHSIFTKAGLRNRLYYPLIYKEHILRKRRLYQACDKYVLLSPSFYPAFKRTTGLFKASKLKSIPNPNFTFEHHSVEKQKENIILFVGRLAYSKRVDKMLEVWNRVSKVLKDWKFIIVGDGDQRKTLEQKVAKEQIPRVSFEGLQNPSAYYQKARLFWMMSQYEGWGMTLIEAMAQGCIPVAWDSYSSLRDIIDDGINGVVIPNGDSATFAKATIKLATSDISEMQKASQEKVNEFDVNNVIEYWIKMLS